MYLLIIFLVVAVLISLIYFRDEWEGVFYTFIWLILIYGMVILLGRKITDGKTSRTEYHDLNIISLYSSQETELSGVFILGTGSVSGGSTDYYITYGKFNAGMKRVKIDAYDTYILETDSQSPKIKKYRHRTIRIPYKSKWFWNRSKTIYGRWWSNRDDLTIIVPTNTILREFRIE